MEDKKQDLNWLEALVKIADSYRALFDDLVNELSKVLPDIEIYEEEEEDTWEMKYPYEEGEKYWVLYDDGTVNLEAWLEYGNECNTFNQGNAFQTKEEAELESKRRNLLTRFRAFRDECNDGWKPDWRKNDAKYYFYISSTDGEIGINDIYFYETFPLFGYFKNEKDAEHAIELFGDEIKELFVDCEG